MFLRFCKGCLSPQKVLLLHWKPSQHGWWKPIIGVLHCRTLWWSYKFRCLWRVNINLHPVVEPLSWTLCFHPPPLWMLCCIWFVALVLHSPLLLAEERKSTFFSCTRENLPLFCARWTCFVCHCSQFSCYVSKLFMLCWNGQSERTQPFTLHQRDG